MVRDAKRLNRACTRVEVAVFFSLPCGITQDANSRSDITIECVSSAWYNIYQPNFCIGSSVEPEDSICMDGGFGSLG